MKKVWVALIVIICMLVVTSTTSVLAADDGNVPTKHCDLGYVNYDYPDLAKPLVFDAADMNGYPCAVEIADARGG